MTDCLVCFMSRPVWPVGHYVSGLSVLPSVRHALGVPLRMQRPAKAMPFQQIIMNAFAIPTWPRCESPILCWPWPPWVPLCVQCPAKAMPFQQIIMHALQCQHDLDVHLLFCVDLDLHNLFPKSCLTFFSSILTDGYHFACSAQQKLCLFNKLSCMHFTTNMT